MVVTQGQYTYITQESAVNRLNQAFERLETAWHTVRAWRLTNGTRQFEAALINELNAAEEEWLAARAAVPTGC